MQYVCRKAETERADALLEQERRLRSEFSIEIVEASQSVRSAAIRETMDRIKPQLQKQESLNPLLSSQ